MKNDLPIKNGIVIPDHELQITASRAGGPGGQHVNKSSTRITVTWNVKNSNVLSDEQKERVLQKLQSRLTSEGELSVSDGSSRSQEHNKKMALDRLADTVRKALHVPKKRMATKIPKGIKEARLEYKARQSKIKKMRSKKIIDY